MVATSWTQGKRIIEFQARVDSTVGSRLSGETLLQANTPI